MKFQPFQFSRAVLLVTALSFVTVTLMAQDDRMSQSVKPAKAGLNFLTAGHPDAAELLPPPPALDSVEQTADMETVKSVYHAANDTDKNAAYSEKKFTVFNFTGAVGPWFVETNLPKTTAFFEKVQTDAETVTDAGKDFFKRPRPYTTDPTLENGKLEKSFSYPSGHSTESMVLALVLADLLPGQHDAIIAHARTMGWHRVQIARHYPTDIYAGRVLAQAIARQFKKSDAFENELVEVQAELKAAKEASRN
ncbi:MAG TPA: phosphatase PAP2 family protein [Candidatus Sulfotelmatobacter sp.]|jgi:acid phosphatase (class A)|nr:phosphatase PAP2 family protein [Candidatus Sulfotelmatobacter sp.]